MVKYQPDGYQSVTPYLRMKNAAQAIEFYKKALGCQERMRMPGPDGESVIHAELELGDSVIMLGEPMQSASKPGEMFGLMVYVKDVDQLFKQAVAAGATVREEPQDMFYGDRMAVVTDPFGFEWMLSTHIEDVSDEEAERRMETQMAGSVTT